MLLVLLSEGCFLWLLVVLVGLFCVFVAQFCKDHLGAGCGSTLTHMLCCSGCRVQQQEVRRGLTFCRLLHTLVALAANNSL